MRFKAYVFYLFFGYVFLSASLFAQDIKGVMVRAIVKGNDTIPIIDLRPVSIYGVRKFSNIDDEKRFLRLVYNVKKVYPYSKKAGVKYLEYFKMIDGISKRGKQLKTMAPVEVDLKKRYMADLKKFTYTQGRILIKLIDRETQHSSFELIKQFRGGFKAFWWQTIAGVFNMDLKKEYDPEGEDKEIEMIVRMIECGDL